MRGLKILVVVMGVMLVVGVAGLVVAIATRLSHRAAGACSGVLRAADRCCRHGPKIETMSIGSDRIVLQVDLADGSVQLIVIDLASGKELGTIPLREQP